MKHCIAIMFFFFCAWINIWGQWVPQVSNVTSSLRDIYVFDALTAVAVGSGGTVIKTNDGGATWSAQTSSTTDDLISVSFADGNNGWAVSSSAVYRTVDGGATWAPYTGLDLDLYTSVCFADISTGLVAGIRNVADTEILKTVDGGLSWEELPLSALIFLFDLHFIDAQTGWVVGTGGSIAKTEDGGNDWSWHTTDPSDNLVSVHFADALSGAAVGGQILTYTADGGANWTRQAMDAASQLLAVHVPAPGTILVAGAGGFIQRSTDGGLTWSEQETGTLSSLNAVGFADANVGWAVGYDGTVLKTVSGGASIRPHAPGYKEPAFGGRGVSGLFSFSITGQGKVFSLRVDAVEAMDLLDARGRLVLTSKVTDLEMVWDGNDDNGVPVEAGIYIVRLKSPAGDIQKKIMLTR
ncbi:YCF48-related protein [Fibrobacterota bacterium]